MCTINPYAYDKALKIGELLLYHHWVSTVTHVLKVHVSCFRYERSRSICLDGAMLFTNPVQKEEIRGEQLTHTMREVVQADLTQSVVSVCGVLLPKMCTREEQVTM